ncbi:MAG: tRNA (adenosine(37)-N6)-threonylcarbamoyltransferase complex ATPase subunit type 1 TsaE [Methylococcaceae bacterium]|nr:tRNA (adenosine(37)-N6)-threonylcarbamoyltransferase complex ATPase subunit type 1 TsaE [Methylococcaceae bacterium]
MTVFLQDQEATEQFGAHLWAALPRKCVIFLQGELGMGKTTLVRGFLRAAGYSGTVKSPTYTLVEEYTLGTCQVVHFDLYRLVDPEELEDLGIRDYFEQESICFIEWPEQGGSLLPTPDLVLQFQAEQAGRDLTVNVLNNRLKI